MPGDDGRPGGRRRAGRGAPEAALRTREPGPAGDGEYGAAGDDLGPAGDEEYGAAGDDLGPAGDDDEAREDQPGQARAGGRAAGGRVDGRPRRGPQHGSARTARQAARAAVRQVMELTGREAETITKLERREDGWMIGIEVVEDHRIPSSADILATYEATVDQDGELISYRRVSRYARGRGDSDGRS